MIQVQFEIVCEQNKSRDVRVNINLLEREDATDAERRIAREMQETNLLILEKFLADNLVVKRIDKKDEQK